MPPSLLLDLSKIDLNAEPAFDKEAICKVNPQRFEMQHLDGILWHDKSQAAILGYKDVTPDEFWGRGHIPGLEVTVRRIEEGLKTFIGQPWCRNAQYHEQ